MTTLEQRLHIGSRAKEVLENEAFIDAFDIIEKEITEQWKTSNPKSADDRERLWMYQMLLQKVKKQLVSTMETGKLAELELKSRQSAWDKAKEWIS